ncbi:Zinc finger MYM-type protein 1 [Merluccius polli]|uniref:ribonuclease H n=1 Tax=Merluccius polli TaxID=89951 RepID=A0AA47M2U7_MERPO|nr:Zinc finger MYM-type protein 1 [Merluccius polli]
MDVAAVNRISVLNLEELWQQQFRTDFPECGHDEQPGQSREDQRFMKLVQDSAKLVDGHYQVALPLRKSCVNMPNNRKVAEQRALNLKRRFKRDSLFQQQYTDFMNDMVAKGYAEQVPSVELARSDGRLWDIPHHGVYHPQKGNICVVFDCAATFQSTSLNAQLLQGPDLTSCLIGVLARFRKEPVVIMADIESMFHQVRVPREDADLLRFLWWPDGDCTQDLVDFRMLVHLFGATSSPSCANFALRPVCELYHGNVLRTMKTTQFCRETIEKLLHCFYVDDCLVSTSSEEEAVALYQDLVCICAKGGFKLTKWMSNRCAVMAAIPENQRAKGIKNLDLDHNLLPVERVLGVQWCIQSDDFKFKIVVQDRPLTRRGILSVISSIYDPLGILSLFGHNHKSAFATNGFCDWKHTGKVLAEHENSVPHRQAMVAYIRQSSDSGVVDTELRKQFNAECEYWRQVLQRVVAVIKHLTERGLPLRGHTHVFGDVRNGNYLGSMELVSQFDPFLKAHIERFGNAGRGNPSYLSLGVCEEFIELMGEKVLAEVVSRVKLAKYFSISVDSTPDVTHVDQLTFILRYIINTKGKRGYMSPIVLSAKIILQELCRQQLGWDDPISPSAAQEWTNWLKELHQLEQRFPNFFSCAPPSTSQLGWRTPNPHRKKNKKRNKALFYRHIKTCLIMRK